MYSYVNAGVYDVVSVDVGVYICVDMRCDCVCVC